MPISPSGITLSAAISSGVPGVLAAVLQANPSLSAKAKVLATGYGSGLYGEISNLSDQYFGGTPVPQADYVTRLADIADALSVLQEVVVEIGQLITANPGAILPDNRFPGWSPNFEGRRHFP